MKFLNLSSFAFRSVSSRVLSILLLRDECHRAAAVVAGLGLSTREEWEDVVTEFEARGSIAHIASHVPTSTSLQLRIETYNLILQKLISECPQKLLLILRNWPVEIYNQNLIIKSINFLIPPTWVASVTSVDAEDDKKLQSLMYSLALLFQVQNEFDAELECYLRLRDYSKIIDKLQLLVSLGFIF
jgi:hypothetical protein